MARMASTGGQGSRSYSYTATESYSLEEAVAKASSGELDPNDVCRQFPSQLQQEIDRLASRQFSQPFSSLALSQQREVMHRLKEEIRAAKEGVSVLDVLKMAKRGDVDDVKIYQALPDELRKVLDALANERGGSNFCGVSLEVRKQVVGVVLEMFEKRAAEDAKRRAEEEASRRAQQEAQRQAEEEVSRRPWEEAKRRAEEEARRQAEEAKGRVALENARRNAKQCTLCGEPIGFLNRLLGREKHPQCTAWTG